jgi:RNA polymerase sigma factor (sigma-70 family)
VIDETILQTIPVRLRTDSNALGALLTLLRPAILRHVESHAGSLTPDACEDVGQEVLVSLALTKPWEKELDTRALLAFVWTVTRCRTVDSLRCQRRAKNAQAGYAQRVARTEGPDGWEYSEAEFSSRYAEELEEMLSSLARDELDQEILRGLSEGISQEAVARRLGVVPGTVSRRVQRMGEKVEDSVKGRHLA